MIETGRPHMWLDARHLGAEFWERRFPTILRVCREHGVDPVDRPDPGRAGPALRVRRGGDRPVGTYDRARGSTPPARSPAPASTAPTGWRPTRCSRGWCSPAASPTCCPASCARGPTRSPRPAPRRPRRRRAPPRHAGGDDHPGRRAAPRRRAHRGAGPPRPRSTDGDAVLEPAAWETTNLLAHQHRAGRGRRAAHRDPRLALARGLPRPRRRRGPATSTPGSTPTARIRVEWTCPLDRPVHAHRGAR